MAKGIATEMRIRSARLLARTTVTGQASAHTFGELFSPFLQRVLASREPTPTADFTFDADRNLPEFFILHGTVLEFLLLCLNHNEFPVHACCVDFRLQERRSHSRFKGCGIVIARLGPPGGNNTGPSAHQTQIADLERANANLKTANSKTFHPACQSR